MRRSWWLVVLLGVVVASALWQPAASQDDAATRIDYQSTRLSRLETRVVNLERTASGGDEATAVPTVESAETTGRHDIFGTLVFGGALVGGLFTDESMVTGTAESCVGGPGHYEGLVGGAEVAAVGPGGDVLAIGEMRPGTFEEGDAGSLDNQFVICSMPFEIRDVPRSDRLRLGFPGIDPVRVDVDDLERDGWTISVELN